MTGIKYGYSDPAAMRWVDELPPRRHAIDPIARALIARLMGEPGSWGTVYVGKSNREISNRRHAFLRAGCEVAQRISDDGAYVLWARYPRDVDA